MPQLGMGNRVQDQRAEAGGQGAGEKRQERGDRRQKTEDRKQGTENRRKRDSVLQAIQGTAASDGIVNR